MNTDDPMGGRGAVTTPLPPIRQTFRLLAPYLCLVAVFFLFSAFGPSAFHSAYNLKTLLTQ